MPGSANFIGEFYILIGVFQAKIVYAFVAIVGVVLAAFYAIRLFQRTMHNQLAPDVESREISLRDAAVLAPLVACIVALALHPGVILTRTQTAVQDKVGAVASNPQPVAPNAPAVRAGAGWTGYAPLDTGEVR
jgi:NADH-quinone oxidoreductase subunit M